MSERPLLPAFENADDARPPRLRFNFPDIQTGTGERARDIFANLGFSRTAGTSVGLMELMRTRSVSVRTR